MPKRQKVLLSVLDNYGGHPFDTIFDVVYPTYGEREVATANALADCAMIIWGGQDISPGIYGQKPNHRTGANDMPGERDTIEIKLANKAIELGIPIIGICRGAQLMCALSGGSLVQHVNNHAGGWHGIVTNDNQQFNCPSLHHQMMHPWPRTDLGDDEVMEFEMIAWSEKKRSDVYLGEPNEENDGLPKELSVPLEPEIIWFPSTKSLCIQSHPEFIESVEHPFTKYCLQLTEKYVKANLNGRG